MPIIFTTLIIFGLSVGAVLVGLVPAFTEDTARAVNVSQKISFCKQLLIQNLRFL